MTKMDYQFNFGPGAKPGMEGEPRIANPTKDDFEPVQDSFMCDFCPAPSRWKRRVGYGTSYYYCDKHKAAAKEQSCNDRS